MGWEPERDVHSDFLRISAKLENSLAHNYTVAISTCMVCSLHDRGLLPSSMSYTRKLRLRKIQSAREEIMKGVASVVENALNIPSSPAANSADASLQGQSTTRCKYAMLHLFKISY